ncbi:MAG: tRNA-dihydrouridine synthase family protein [archaeon]|nr:MAG: tRNA-dihydrouridine synthase family protein [archaeon]
MKIPCKNRIFLAPMAEINDIAFRLLCKKAGCGLTYTGMITPLTKQKWEMDDKPALQLFSTSTRGVKEFIKKYENKVTLFDYNLGCPAPTARKQRFGYFIQSKLKTIEKILQIMRKSTKKPITIKLRKSKYALKIAKIAEKYVDAIGIHPRKANQGYSGTPDLDFALKLKKSVKVPIIYSGNVNETNYKSLLKKFDYIMIGRRAIGDPNIFAKLTKKKSNLGFKDYLKLAKKYKFSFTRLKRQAISFTKRRAGAKKLRLKLIKTKNIKEIEKINV